MTWSDYDSRIEQAAHIYAGDDEDLYAAFMAGAGKAKYLTMLKKGCEHAEAQRAARKYEDADEERERIVIS